MLGHRWKREAMEAVVKAGETGIPLISFFRHAATQTEVLGVLGGAIGAEV